MKYQIIIAFFRVDCPLEFLLLFYIVDFAILLFIFEWPQSFKPKDIQNITPLLNEDNLSKVLEKSILL